MSKKKKAVKKTRKLGNYFKEVKIELKKVSWPSKNEIISSTVIVLFLTVIFSAFIGGFDYLFTIILKLISV